LEYPSTPEYLEWRCMSAPCVGVPEYTPEYLEYCKRSTEVLREYWCTPRTPYLENNRIRTECIVYRSANSIPTGSRVRVSGKLEK
jgi:hypothetical protein